MQITGSGRSIRYSRFIIAAKGSAVFWAVYGGWSDPFFGQVRRPWNERLRTIGKILTDIAENDSPDVRPRDIVSRHAQDLIGKLRGRGRKRKKKMNTTVKKPGVKKPNLTNRDIFS